MIISVCGYGYSGSGAVLDFLREVEICSCPHPELEFLLLYNPGGIEDLEYQLMERKTRYLASDIAIKNFLKLVRIMDRPRGIYRRCTKDGFRTASERFIQKVTQVSWKASYYNDLWIRDRPYRSLMARRNKFIMAFEQKRKRKWQYSENDKMYLSIAPDNFYTAAREYLCDVLDMLGYDPKKTMLLNQAFDVYAPERSMKYFEDPFAVIVDRDPRDIYVLAKKILMSKAAWIPTDDVRQFIQYHQLVRQRSTYESRPDVIYMKYEDLVYRYQETAEWLLRRLKLNGSEKTIRRFFDPDVSIENTQLFKRYPELEEDIKVIERELPEYLYPFEIMTQRPKGELQPF